MKRRYSENRKLILYYDNPYTFLYCNNDFTTVNGIRIDYPRRVNVIVLNHVKYQRLWLAIQQLTVFMNDILTFFYEMWD